MFGSVVARTEKTISSDLHNLLIYAVKCSAQGKNFPPSFKMHQLHLLRYFC